MEVEPAAVIGDSAARVREAVRESKLRMAQVQQSLSAFQTGLVGVEREMMPVYKLTEQLRGTQKNIDLSVRALRQVRENFVAAHELAPALLGGSMLGQDEYLQALQKLLAAIDFLERHHSYEGSVKALDQARELLAKVRYKCKNDFVSVVGVLSHAERDATDALVWSSPNKVDAARVAQLLDCLLLSSIDQTELLSEYGNQRFKVIKLFLTRKASTSFLGFDLNAPVAELAASLKDIETTLEAERTLTELVFSSEELANTAFRHTAYPILEAWRKELDGSLGTSSSPKHPSAAKLLLVHELLSAHSEPLKRTVQPPLLLRGRKGNEMEDPWVLSKVFGGIVADVTAIAKQKLFGFDPDQMERSGPAYCMVSKDGNVHPIASHTLSFLRKICGQAKPLKSLLANDSSVSPVSFIDMVITQLVEMLRAESEFLSGRVGLKSLFLANNFGYIASSLPHCVQPSDTDLEDQFHGVIKPRLEVMHGNALSQFIETSYASFLEYLKDPKEKLQYTKGGNLLTLESGRLLKEKFVRFNTQLEELHKAQRHFIVAVPSVREQLIQAAIDAIIPPYKAFYEKYSTVHFSKKNSMKYLKYTPTTAEDLLRELFTGESSTGSKQGDRLGSS